MLAPAKVNLTLHVTGQRSDGYHLLDSLVVFTDVGDEVSVRPSDRLELQISGPEGRNLSAKADNLVLRAAKLLQDTEEGAVISLVKNLPVSSGIGGGSTDAATTLQVLAELWDKELPDAKSVLALGADVPVCLARKPVRMEGIGEELAPLTSLPEMAIVLVNPRQEVSTPAVFSKLARRENLPMETVPVGMNYAEFCKWLGEQRNDLEAPAILVAPVIQDVLAALHSADVARMSGSGATCFGLFENQQLANEAEDRILQDHPNWWVKAAKILP